MVKVEVPTLPSLVVHHFPLLVVACASPNLYFITLFLQNISAFLGSGAPLIEVNNIYIFNEVGYKRF
jgi:hypothetical protein